MRYQDLIKACEQDWAAYTEHEFVRLLATGELPQPCYLHYLKQDFLFLKQYARAYALAIYKARTLAEMRQFLPSVQALLQEEISHHVRYCNDWGLTELDLEAQTEEVGTVAYTRYVLDTGMSGDVVQLYTALAPCFIGYAQIGRALVMDKRTLKEGNPYTSWIDLYSGDDLQQSTLESQQYLDVLLADIDVHSAQGKTLIEVFRNATRMEIAFWEQSLKIRDLNADNQGAV
ncbi:transcriptional activator [Psychromonas sp. CNPT3]|uniref:TenA family protein n=1 Tax=Psychromonas sp. CNPT3 TaxID=314282 RepID=UPI00006E425F|nr:TenA family protein [Psychromonas sp. CNPT3]AGH81064.1 transcriptional activator [Psychromonas sp. CNPT3]